MKKYYFKNNLHQNTSASNKSIKIVTKMGAMSIKNGLFLNLEAETIPLQVPISKRTGKWIFSSSLINVLAKFWLS